jgi:hypothetical protein
MLPAFCMYIFLYSLHCLQYSELLQVLQQLNWYGKQAKGQAQGIVLSTPTEAGGSTPSSRGVIGRHNDQKRK